MREISPQTRPVIAAREPGLKNPDETSERGKVTRVRIVPAHAIDHRILRAICPN